MSCVLQGCSQHYRHLEDMDEGVIEERLRQQQKESEEDAKWLQMEDKVLVCTDQHTYNALRNRIFGLIRENNSDLENQKQQSVQSASTVNCGKLYWLGHVERGKGTV